MRTRRRELWLLIAALILMMAGCADDEGPSQQAEPYRVMESTLLMDELAWICGPYPEELLNGLSQQLIDEVNCIQPGVLEPFDISTDVGSIYIQTMRAACSGTVPNNVPRYLRPEVKAALEGVAAQYNDYITIRSAYRDVGMQYYDWYHGQILGFPAAIPGSSNHQAGRAVDVESHDYWRATLLAEGWTCLNGSTSSAACQSDPPHFEWPSTNVPDLQVESVRAFQRLWNRNNASDVIAEDGAWGPNTGARMAQTSASGFTYGGCDVDRDGQASTAIGGTDCVDTDPNVYSGAAEICGDNIDQDCVGGDLMCTGADASSSSGADMADTFSPVDMGGPDTSSGAQDTSSGAQDTSSGMSSSGAQDTSSGATSSGADATTDLSEGDTTSPPVSKLAGSDDGCGCQAVRKKQSGSSPVWSLLLLGLVVAARRRRDTPAA